MAAGISLKGSEFWSIKTKVRLDKKFRSVILACRGADCSCFCYGNDGFGGRESSDEAIIGANSESGEHDESPHR